MGTVDNIFVLYGIIIHTLNDGNFDSVVRENLYVSGNSVTDINVSGNSVTDMNVSGNSWQHFCSLWDNHSHIKWWEFWFCY